MIVIAFNYNALLAIPFCFRQSNKIYNKQ